MTFSADGLVASIFCLIVIPSKAYDEPENLLSQLAQFCLIGADAGQATRSAMSDMAKSLERDPQLESLLANRKKDLGIGIESGRSLGRELAFTHGIDFGRGRGIGL